MIIYKDGNGSSNETIRELFGSMDNFLYFYMITQNVDNDILLLNYKDTLATIDKAHNIQYIYHLYNLFKTAINKYRDLRKIITSKKNEISNDTQQQPAILKLFADNFDVDFPKNKN